MRRTVLTFGLISGGILAAMFVITFPFHDEIGFDRAEIIGYSSMVAAFLLVYFGIRSYRDNVGAGSISFGRGLAVGSLIVVVASLCYVAMWQVIYYGFGGDTYLQKYETHVVATARKDGASEAEIEKQVADLRKFAELYRNPLVNVAVTFVEPLPVGLLLALVSAAMLRRRNQATGDPARAPTSIPAGTR